MVLQTPVTVERFGSEFKVRGFGSRGLGCGAVLLLRSLGYAVESLGYGVWGVDLELRGFKI